MATKQDVRLRRRRATLFRPPLGIVAPEAAKDMGPCSYCGRTYRQNAASVHFIPCCFCQELEHAGCQH